MNARMIDGKAVAGELRGAIAAAVAASPFAPDAPPGLHVVLIGDDPASSVYVASKERLARQTGFRSITHRLPAETPQEALLELIARLNADPSVDGILVQLPLPKGINVDAVVDAIDPAKDVDGFHPVNVGRLAAGRADLVPCTPQGAIILLRRTLPALAGLDALVLGRSAIVGRPMSQLLVSADCTVTIAHSRTRDLPGLCRRADIVIAAVGRPEMVRGDWLKPGATIIDVGINRLADGRLVGDVHAESALPVAGALTPVPGGVGPMTIACLLRNTLVAAALRRGWPVPTLAGF